MSKDLELFFMKFHALKMSQGSGFYTDQDTLEIYHDILNLLDRVEGELRRTEMGKALVTALRYRQ